MLKHFLLTCGCPLISSYTLVWSDEFNGSLDYAWNVEQTNITYNDEEEEYPKNNVYKRELGWQELYLWQN
jgi:hypothetical protein